MLLSSRKVESMKLSGFEKIEGILDESEVNAIERLIIDQINLFTQVKIKSLKKYHFVSDSVHQQLLSKKDARVFTRKSVEKYY